MAFVNIEDLYGNLETIVFENCYQTSTNSLLEDNIVLVEGRLSIREDEENVTIIASKMGTFPYETSVPNETLKKKKLEINITNLTEEQKNRLRGTLKYFSGDRNNIAIQIANENTKSPAGGIFLNGNTLEQIEEIVGKENCNIE